MLRTNLSTRPFYNERALRVGLGLVGAVLAAVLVYDIVEGVRSSRRLGELSAQVSADEARTQELRASAARLRAGIDVADLERVQTAAREANGIIDNRTFSWTRLLNHLETTLPDGVLLSAVGPRIEDETVRLTLTIVGRRVEDIDRFMERLEETGAFKDVLSTDEATDDEGRFRATVVGRYLPEGTPVTPDATVAPAAAEGARP
jgi:hypothetical protein